MPPGLRRLPEIYRSLGPRTVVKKFAMDSYDALHKQVPFESKEPDFGDASVDIVIPSIRDLTFLEVCPWLVFGLSVA